MNPNEIRGRADTSSPPTLPEMNGDMASCSSTDEQPQKVPMDTESMVLPSEFSAAHEAQQLVNLYLNLDWYV
ncbi:hypothetical protein COOONC_19187 [Cooperia oncophora]